MVTCGVLTPLCYNTGLIQIKPHSSVPLHLLVFYFSNNVDVEGPINLLRIRILSSMNRATLLTLKSSKYQKLMNINDTTATDRLN